MQCDDLPLLRLHQVLRECADAATSLATGLSFLARSICRHAKCRSPRLRAHLSTGTTTRNQVASLCRTTHANDLLLGQSRCLRTDETRAIRQGIQIVKVQVLCALATTCHQPQSQTLREWLQHFQRQWLRSRAMSYQLQQMLFLQAHSHQRALLVQLTHYLTQCAE